MDSPSKQGSMFSRFPDAGFAPLASVVTAILVFGGGFLTAWLAFQSKDQELCVHLVDTAISILRADPKEDVAPARSWAISIIEKNSGVAFSAEDRAALLHRPLGIVCAHRHMDSPKDNPLGRSFGKLGAGEAFLVSPQDLIDCGFEPITGF